MRQSIPLVLASGKNMEAVFLTHQVITCSLLTAHAAVASPHSPVRFTLYPQSSAGDRPRLRHRGRKIRLTQDDRMCKIQDRSKLFSWPMRIEEVCATASPLQSLAHMERMSIQRDRTAWLSQVSHELFSRTVKYSSFSVILPSFSVRLATLPISNGRSHNRRPSWLAAAVLAAQGGFQGFQPPRVVNLTKL